MGLTRRRFISSSSLAAGGVAIEGLVRPQSLLAAETADVTVIGAGLSGLMAALSLKDLGYNVTVLEASSRVGGRAYTADSIDGRPEFGASQVGPLYARTRDVAERLGVGLAQGSNINAPFTFSVRGQLVRKEDWESSSLNEMVGEERAVLPSALLGYYLTKYNPFSDIEQWLDDGAEVYDISIGEWLQQIGTSPAVIHLINEGSPNVWNDSLLHMLGVMTRYLLRQESSGAKPSADQSFFEQNRLMTARVVGGTSRLPEAMANELGESIRLNKIVTRIDMDDTTADITCLDGSRFTSNFIVAAIPFSVLRHVNINPPLVGDQNEAVNFMPYGSTTLVYMNVKKPFWEDDGMDASLWTDGPINLVRQPLDYDGTRDRLVALSLGSKGKRLDQLPPKERGAFVVQQIEQLRPSTKGRIEVTGVHSWVSQPFIVGCESSLPPRYAFRHARAMIEPHGVLHFAGEHTRRLEIGMESAMESGERVALEIIERT